MKVTSKKPNKHHDIYAYLNLFTVSFSVDETSVELQHVYRRVSVCMHGACWIRLRWLSSDHWCWHKWAIVTQSTLTLPTWIAFLFDAAITIARKTGRGFWPAIWYDLEGVWPGLQI